ncbi:FAS-associated factor 2 [Bombus vosnesenskii]|uniref:FAS-associated factor 2 n=3 Tax=Pyrobombus TaxID=144703 RepID=A0A6J3KZH1_9HYME|nr:FAS-associated factor 2 [Bombus impatiens]XP_033198028.1 FAS-associated factor 2 [Bombus vancouverensis nearcticus]XP_033302851.1 FAS-associated factor 2 [Bombus bifarius]XP_033357234.1 FAS-associated factor 2 [Bombus vosnesenskii]XP_050469412.1 FAS-associated factor 2 [Bombus huntii]
MADFALNGFSSDQTEKILQFQDLTGIEDLSICRDVLQRHNWNLEVAVQEQLNLYEGRPSMYAQDSRSRPPQVVDDSSSRIYFHYSGSPSGRGSYLWYIFSLCYERVISILQLLLSIFRRNVRPVSSDPVEDVINFIRSYEESYGNSHPVFYQGSYSQALSDAKQELRFLLVYLHKDEAQNVDQWCRNTLGNVEVVQYVNTHTLFWACNVKSGEGYKVAEALKSGSYPFLAIIVLRDNRMTIVGRMEGTPSPSELISRLQTFIDHNEINLIQARQERAERSAAQSLRQQQDQAYEESLRADQEKDRRREEERRAREEREAREKEQLNAQEMEIQRIRREKELTVCKVPLEPEPTDPNACHLQIKLGERTMKRRFLMSDTLEDVYHWIFSQPDSPVSFEITTSFPKRILYPCREILTLSDAGLTHREVLHVNDLDD